MKQLRSPDSSALWRRALSRKALVSFPSAADIKISARTFVKKCFEFVFVRPEKKKKTVSLSAVAIL